MKTYAFRGKVYRSHSKLKLARRVVKLKTSVWLGKSWLPEQAKLCKEIREIRRMRD
jgi:hypothetical protein